MIADTLKLLYKTSDELNKLIDTALPGGLHFKCHKIMVSGKVCKVYMQDLLACVKVLFGEPAFAPYLIVTPEKHYANEEKSNHVYHDIHMGRWWWSTQVSPSESQ
jgi:Plavaka transposase